MFYNFNQWAKVEDASRRMLLEYISTGNSTLKLTDRIRQRVGEAHMNPMWRKTYMTLDMMIYEARKVGKKEGREEGKTEMIRAMLDKGLDVPLIAEIAGVTEDEILAHQVICP